MSKHTFTKTDQIALLGRTLRKMTVAMLAVADKNNELADKITLLTEQSLLQQEEIQDLNKQLAMLEARK